MVNKTNNKNTNIINIVNDLKGLGLLKSKRKRRRQPSEQVGKVIINPNRQLTGIEKVVIDNSPFLRRDVERIVQEKSLLDDKVMENENRLRFMFDELDSGRAFNRFINENQNMGSSQGLANVQSNSLNLPSMTQLYDEDQKLKTDSIDVPIVDASSSFKRADEEQATPAPVPTTIDINSQPAEKLQPPEEESTLQPKVLFQDIYKEDNETPLPVNPLSQKRKKVRSTSPKPSPKKTPAPTQDIDLLSPVSSAKIKVAKQKEKQQEDYDEYMKSVKEINKGNIDTISSVREKKEKNRASREELLQLEEDLQKARDEKKNKLLLNQKRKEQEAILKEMKLKEMQTMEEVAKERKMQDEQTDLLTEKFFKELGGKDYVIKNYAKDLDELYKFSKTNKLLNTSNNKELTEKYVKYLNLSGIQNSSKIAGRGYSSTNILLNLEKIKQGIKKRFRIYDPSTRSVSAMPRITMMKTMRDLEKTVDTNTKASSNMKADKII